MKELPVQCGLFLIENKKLLKPAYQGQQSSAFSAKDVRLQENYFPPGFFNVAVSLADVEGWSEVELSNQP